MPGPNNPPSDLQGKQLVNVSDGTKPTDAVNVRQMEEYVAEHGIAEWQPGTEYAAGSVTTHESAIYRALVDTDTEPPSEDWEALSTEVKTRNSIRQASTGEIELVGDMANPPPSSVYRTNELGIKGWWFDEEGSNHAAGSIAGSGQSIHIQCGNVIVELAYKDDGESVGTLYAASGELSIDWRSSAIVDTDTIVSSRQDGYTLDEVGWEFAPTIKNSSDETFIGTLREGGRVWEVRYMVSGNGARAVIWAFMVYTPPVSFQFECTPTTAEPLLLINNLTVPAGDRPNVIIDWGDGNVTEGITGTTNFDHTYDTVDGPTYTVRVWGAENATVLHIYNVDTVGGALSGFSNLTNLTELRLDRTNIEGYIDAVSGFSNLTTLYLYSTNIEGYIDAVSGLVNLTDLRLYSTNISGDIDAVSGLTNLTELRLSGNNNASGIPLTCTAADWGSVNMGTMYARACDLDATNLGQLIDILHAERATLGAASLVLALQGNPGSAAVASSHATQIGEMVSAGCTVTI